MCQDVRGDVAIKTTTMLALAALNIFAGFFMSRHPQAALALRPRNPQAALWLLEKSTG